MREDARRPSNISDDELEERWAEAFEGKSMLLDEDKEEEDFRRVELSETENIGNY